MKYSRLVALSLVTLVSGFAWTASASETTEAAQEAAETMTEHREPEARAAALVAIGRVGTEEQRQLLENFHSANTPQEQLAAGIGQLLADQEGAAAFTAEQILAAGEVYRGLQDLAVMVADEQVLAVVDALLMEAEGAQQRDIFRFLGAQRDGLYESLTERLRDSDEALRAAALEAVVYTAGEPTLDIAESLAGARDSDIRAQALPILERLAPRDDLRSPVVAVLEDLSGDGDEAIKIAASRQLVTLGEQSGATVLVDSLADIEGEQRVERLEFLSAHDAPADLDAIRPLIESLEAAGDDERQRERRLLYELAATDADDDLVADLREKYRSTHFDERLVAFQALGRTGRDAVRSLLEQELGAGRADIRRLSARALGHLANPASLNPLRSALSGERDTDVRQALITTIGKIQDPQSVQVLRFLTTERDPAVKLTIIEAFDNLALPEATQALELLIRDRDPQVQWQAFLVLLKLDGERATRHLSTVLRNPPNTFATDIDPYELTSQAREALYEAMVTHETTRVRSTATEHGLVYREAVAPILRDLALSDEVPDDTRRAIVHLLVSEDNDDDLAIFERMVNRYGDQQSAKLAAWYLVRHASPAFAETFEELIGDSDDDEADPVLAIIGHVGQASLDD